MAKKKFQIMEEQYPCEAKARKRLEEIKFSIRQSGSADLAVPVSVWEVSEQEDIFGNKKQVKQLVTRYTPSLPNNGLFRVQDSYDVRRSKKMYSLQKYDSENHCWNNFKLGDNVNDLWEFANKYSVVKDL